MTSIDAIIANHLKMLFGDVTNETFNKLHSRNGFSDEHVILMAIIVESDSIIFFIIGINTGSSNDRTPEISADILKDLVRITLAGFEVNIEPIFRTTVYLRFDLFEFRRKFCLKKI